ncbi:hypothetical protein LCGC14_0196000 [marine sediment metagenome]|uniref:Uncharacterized protein n=1 Tax=marine sediment metagenome TaxID=412755 RepID=A0A0F9V257_9ZZZZ
MENITLLTPEPLIDNGAEKELKKRQIKATINGAIIGHSFLIIVALISYINNPTDYNWDGVIVFYLMVTIASIFVGTVIFSEVENNWKREGNRRFKYIKYERKNDEKTAYHLFAKFLTYVYNGFSTFDILCSDEQDWEDALLFSDLTIPKLNPYINKKHLFDMAGLAMNDISQGLTMIKEHGKITEVENYKKLLKLRV